MKKIKRDFTISLKLVNANCIEVEYSLLFDEAPTVSRKSYWVITGDKFDIMKVPVFDNGVIYAILSVFGYEVNKELNDLINQLNTENPTTSKTFTFIEKK